MWETIQGCLWALVIWTIGKYLFLLVTEKITKEDLEEGVKEMNRKTFQERIKEKQEEKG